MGIIGYPRVLIGMWGLLSYRSYQYRPLDCVSGETCVLGEIAMKGPCGETMLKLEWNLGSHLASFSYLCRPSESHFVIHNSRPPFMRNIVFSQGLSKSADDGGHSRTCPHMAGRQLCGERLCNPSFPRCDSGCDRRADAPATIRGSHRHDCASKPRQSEKQ